MSNERYVWNEEDVEFQPDTARNHSASQDRSLTQAEKVVDFAALETAMDDAEERLAEIIIEKASAARDKLLKAIERGDDLHEMAKSLNVRLVGLKEESKAVFTETWDKGASAAAKEVGIQTFALKPLQKKRWIDQQAELLEQELESDLTLKAKSALLNAITTQAHTGDIIANVRRVFADYDGSSEPSVKEHGILKK